MNALGNLIRAERKERRMSLATLAESTGITQGYLSQIELGKSTNPGIITCLRLSIALGISMNEVSAAALLSHEAALRGEGA